MPQSLIAMLRSTLHDIESYEMEHSATPVLQEAKLAIQEAIEALESRITTQMRNDTQDSK